MRKTGEILYLMAMLISPLAIIGFVFSIIPLLESVNKKWDLIHTLEKDGKRVMAQVEDSSERYLLLRLLNERKEGARRVFLYRRYYPPQVMEEVQQQPTVAVLDTGDEQLNSTVLLADQLGQFKRSWYYLRIPLVMMGICWAIIVVCPEWLYLGIDPEPKKQEKS